MFDVSDKCSASLLGYPIPLAYSTGLFIDNKIVICGGIRSTDMTCVKKCYQLKNSYDSFELVYSMKEERKYSKSISLQGNMLVTGGSGSLYCDSKEVSDTGEYINLQFGNNSAPKPDIKLPEPFGGHSLIKINESMVFLLGGVTNWNAVYNFSKTTYYWNINSNEWKRGPDLKIGRYGHTAGVLIDHATNTKIVAVVGGEPHCCDWVATNSVELLKQGQNDWITGIEFMYSFESSKIPKILQKLFCRSTFTQRTYQT